MKLYVTEKEMDKFREIIRHRTPDENEFIFYGQWSRFQYSLQPGDFCLVLWPKWMKAEYLGRALKSSHNQGVFQMLKTGEYHRMGRSLVKPLSARGSGVKLG